MDYYNKIDELMNKTCYVIDILPKRVEKENGGQYFAVEDYYQRKTESIAVNNGDLYMVLYNPNE